jgi:hypothetical protein
MIIKFLIPTFIYSVSFFAQNITESSDFKFDPTFAVWVELPEGMRFEPDYPSKDSLNFHKCVQIDLDDDGIPENLWVNLCGTGGCVFTIHGGKDGKYLGEIFGDPVIVRKQKINEMPVINTYSHDSAASGDYYCYIFNGEEYVMVSEVYLLEETITNLFEKFKSIHWFSRKM